MIFIIRLIGKGNLISPSWVFAPCKTHVTYIHVGIFAMPLFMGTPVEGEWN